MPLLKEPAVSDKKIDRASDAEFAKVIADAVPEAREHHILASAVKGYLIGRALKSATKKR